MTQSAPPRSITVRIAAVRLGKSIKNSLLRGRLALLACAVLLLMPAVSIAADPATVSFSLDFPASDPEHYSISVTSEGHASYECSARTLPDSDDRQTYQTEFEVTPATRARIFDLA